MLDLAIDGLAAVERLVVVLRQGAVPDEVVRAVVPAGLVRLRLWNGRLVAVVVPAHNPSGSLDRNVKIYGNAHSGIIRGPRNGCAYVPVEVPGYALQNRERKSH